MARGNYIVSIAALAVSAAFFFFASEFKPIVDGAPGPGFVPKVLSTAMAALAVCLFIQTMMKSRRDRAAGVTEKPVFSTPSMKQAYRMAAASVGYAALVCVIGFVLGTLIYLPAGMRIMGERRKKNMALVSIGVVIAFFVVFRMFFGMPLPSGILFD